MKILCVHSFAVHGTASMKAVLSILGTRILPVPSLYLSALTNIPGYIKTELPFKKMFESTLELSRSRQERIIMYIGYLGKGKQAEIILEGIASYRDIIESVWVDPVCGDQGRIYVPEDVWKAWPALLEIADWTFPNYTEAQLLMGNSVDLNTPAEEVIEAFHQCFPNLSFIITGIPHGKKLSLAMYTEANRIFFEHRKAHVEYGGTGDVFLSYFILYAYYQGQSFASAMEKAALKTLSIIDYSLNNSSKDLILFPLS